MPIELPNSRLVSPAELKALLWPDVEFYRQQWYVIDSVVRDDETYVPAGNKLGKDFVAAFIVLYVFLTRRPCRIVLTSAKDHHLDVLWGEILRFVARSKFPLATEHGGPLLINHHHIRKVRSDGTLCPISYITAMVASDKTIAAMQGHHANPDTVEEANDGVPRTLFVSDESSSVPDEYYSMVTSWAVRKLIFGNTWDCANFFYRGVKGGDLPDPANPGRYHRKVIRIRAADSPNVRLGLIQRERGETPTNAVILPGVKPWAEYALHLATLNDIERSVILDAEFYEGKELRLFPADWLQRAARWADLLQRNGIKRKARALGIDPAEGGDKTAMCAVDEYGIVASRSRRTPNTVDVVAEAKAFVRELGVPPDRIVFDRGGGGKQHADRMIEDGWAGVRSVGFGESMQMELRTGIRLLPEKEENRQERYVYVNRRAQMYGDLRSLLDPSLDYLRECRPDLAEGRGPILRTMAAAMEEGPVAETVGRNGTAHTLQRVPTGWGIPASETELIRQLTPMPLLYDGEGRMRMLPKHKKNPDSDEKTLTDLIGCSPDEADACVLAVHGMLYRATVLKAGVF